MSVVQTKRRERKFDEVGLDLVVRNILFVLAIAKDHIEDVAKLLSTRNGNVDNI